MKKLIYLIILLAASVATAQTKPSLGVGVTTPNPNAALHVESPANNQGFIMPRLTTAQRNAMSSILKAADDGLLVYDKDIDNIFIWDGTKWKLTAVTTSNYIVTDAASTVPALSATTNSNQAGGTGFKSTTTGTGDAAATFVTENTTNTNPTVYAENRGAGAGVKGSVTTGAGAAVHATTAGAGNAALIETTNTASSAPSLLINNAGKGNALETTGNVQIGALKSGNINVGTITSKDIDAGGDVTAAAFIGDGSQLTGVAATGLTLPATLNQANAGLSTAALTITNAGTGNAIETTGKIQAGFLIGDGSLLTNVSASPFTFPFNTPQNTATTTFDVTNSGAGGSGKFSINNASSAQYALIGQTNGANLSAGVFGNNTGDGFGVFGKSNGTSFGSAAVYGEHIGTGDAAGAFRISNSSNTYSALYGETNGSGAAVFASQLGLGRAGQFQISNASNTEHALRAYTDGTGRAGFFTINNAASTAYSVVGETNGAVLSAGVYGNNTGGGFGVVGKSNGSALGSAAVYGEQKGTGDAAGAFRIDNVSNNYAALYGETNSTGAGSAAIRGLNLGGGNGAYFRKNGANGTTAAMWADNFGTDGYGAIIQNTDATNPKAALFAESVGTGPSIWANKEASATGRVIEATHKGSGEAGSFSIDNTSNSSDAIYGSTNGSGAAISAGNNGTGRAGYFSLSNNANTSPAVTVQNNGASNGLESFIDNTSSNGVALVASTNGLGGAGYFTIDNAASTAYAVVGETNGDVLSAGVYGNNTGGGFGVYGKSNGSALGSAAVYGEQIGTGDAAGAFRINNSGNISNAVYGETNGTASAINANQLGTGTGLTAQINNGSNSANAIRGLTNGTGNALLLNHTGAGVSSTTNNNVAVFQSNSSNVARIDKTGQGFFNGGTVNTGADVAEAFEVEGSVSTYEPGDVLVISETTDRTVEKSSTANSRKVVGVYATKPGVLLTEKGIDDDLGNTVPMGVIGVIPTKVCLENGPIKRGDLLVTSSETGKAMKAKPVILEGVEIYPNGAILGKALENYDGTGKGLINVLVNVK